MQPALLHASVAFALLTLSVPARGADLFDSIDLVAAELRAPDVARRRDAVDKLDAYGPGAAAPYLMSALGDEDLQVRTLAARSLGRHRLASAVDRLIALVGDPEPKMRAASAEALGQIGDPRAVPALERALGDAEHEVRAQAVQAIGRMPGPRARAASVALAARLDDDNTAVRQRAAEVLARVGDGRAVIPLIGRLGDPSREVRSAALDALGRLGDERAAPAMIRLLRAEPQQPLEVQSQAVQSLGRLRSRAAVPPLIELLERGHESLRGPAAFALGQIAGRPNPDSATQSAVTALLSALGRDDARGAAREALARVGAPAVLPLVARMRGAHGDELGTVVLLLGELRDPRAARPLLEELGRGRVGRERVIDALAAIAREADRRAPAAAAGAERSETVLSLVALLADPDTAVRRRAAEGLRGLCDGRAVAALAEAVADPDRAVRLAVLGELGRLGGKAVAALPALTRALERGDDETASAAARALAQLGPGASSEAAVALVKALDRPEPRVRRDAADALARTPGAAREVPALLLRARSSPADRRPDAIAALAAALRRRPEPPRRSPSPVGASKGDPIARELLLGYVEGDDPAAALAAVDALAAIHDPEALARLQRLMPRAADAGLRRRLVAAVGELDGDPGLLAARLDDDADPRVRAEAAWALGKVGRTPVAAGSPLGRALGSTAPGGRANAAAAVARLGRGAAVEALLTRQLEDRDPAARANAALALAGRPAARAAIDRLKTDDDPRVRAAASRALSGAAAGPRSDWLVVHVVDFDAAPVPEARYQLLLPDGIVKVGHTDARGAVREESVPTGTCTVELADDAVPIR
ncbi:MAG TPA: HEAT repeat domain-containing protein [Kofleriaceae bacterium]|nr:HEAT repeat domain-containing protein [Kofleriaceae bacterium]